MLSPDIQSLTAEWQVYSHTRYTTEPLEQLEYFDERITAIMARCVSQVDTDALTQLRNQWIAHAEHYTADGRGEYEEDPELEAAAIDLSRSLMIVATNPLEKLWELALREHPIYNQEMHDAFYVVNTEHQTFLNGEIFNGPGGYNAQTGASINPGATLPEGTSIPLQGELFQNLLQAALTRLDI
ncbi:MAG: hypothetical protein KBC64_06570 [Simkaniaceae bacterium]|nr:hypothetical protein [Simkaniaceae bacterium]